MLASTLADDHDADPDGVARVLADARAAHGLTVADCGTLASHTARIVIAACSRVLWVLPATDSAVVRGQRVLERRAPAPDTEPCIIARLDQQQRKAALPALAALADSHRATLILHPHIDDLSELPVAAAIDRAALALQAIAGVLAR